MAIPSLSQRDMLSNAGRAGRGDNRALESTLRQLIYGGGYTTYAGSPSGVVTPERIGQALFDSTNGIFYIATGLTSSTWSAVAGSPTGLVSAGNTLAVTAAAHAGRIILLNSLTGSVATLPAATGSGAQFTFMVSVLATSNSHIVKVTTTDIIQGVISTIDTDTAGTITGWATAADSDTITLNRSTTGSAMRGEWFTLTDAVAALWLVGGQLANTGNGATPFSATV